ncbi:MAG: translocation/assembly module TamB [Muribaculaceae bacterium]|jgi:hypothetical protein|nr:translocation/assembly module TamB [Muribaculaceae bacterium]
MKITYNIYKVIRSIIVTAIALIIGVYVITYILLSVPAVQDKIRAKGEKELSALLHTNVKIGQLAISPFSQVELYDVLVPDQRGDSLMKVQKLGAGISIYNLLVKKKLVFTYAEILGLEGHITRDNPNAPTNLQFIIDALKSKDKNKPPTQFDIKIYNIVIRRSSITYDVLSEARKIGKFDKNHLAVSNLKADIALPQLKNDNFLIDINRLSLKEKSGINLESLSANLAIGKKAMDIKNLQIELPNTEITPEDIHLDYSDLNNLGNEIKNIPITLNIANSYVTLADFAGFVPALANFQEPIQVTLSASGTIHDMDIPSLSITTKNQRLTVAIAGRIQNIDNKNINATFPHIAVKANAAEIANLTSHFASLSPWLNGVISRCGNVHLDGSLAANKEHVSFNGFINTSLGNVNLNGKFAQMPERKQKQFNGTVSTTGFKLGTLLDKNDILGETAFDIRLDGTKSPQGIAGKVNGNIKYADVKGYRYNNITANVEFAPSLYKGNVKIDDKNLQASIEGLAHLAGAKSRVDTKIDVANVNPANLGLYKKYPYNNLKFTADASFTGSNIENATGNISVNNFSFDDTSGKGIHLKDLKIDAQNNTLPHSVTITSDLIDGKIIGEYNFKDLVPAIKGMLSQPFPSIFGEYAMSQHKRPNDFNFAFTVKPNKEIPTFFKLPIQVIDTIHIDGNVSETAHNFAVNIDAPYLQQGNKLIQGTHLEAALNSAEDNVTLQGQTIMPSKNGQILLNLNANGVNNQIDSDISWKINRKQDYSGEVSTSTHLTRDENNKLAADLNVNPTKIVINDTAWQIIPSKVDIAGGVIKVTDFMASCDKQFVKINGKVSHDPEDELCVELNDMSLDYVFETLNIDNVDFGGRATGKFYASNLYGKMPRLETPKLHVERFSYNKAILGNADIKSHFENSTKGITLDANITNKDGQHSFVDGTIFPTEDSLYLEFNADKINVAFLKPIMSAFTTDVQGQASGHAVLFGNFHRIDLMGDLYAQNFRMKIGYTNVEYSVTDSVHIKPGLIAFNNVVLHDRDGHTAKMTGTLTHTQFHNPMFQFSITDARNLLCYDITPQINSEWYGTIYGNGTAFISGVPGTVNIDVNMATAANSKFTFVMSDTQEATNYNFITFNDRNKKNAPSEEETDTRPAFVKGFEKKQTVQQESHPTIYRINLQAEITPLATMILVMDPVGGDRIKATGNGHLRMSYSNADDQLTMYGKYTLDKGDYNFTLQDIIIKDFTIREGSTISFHGDPYTANLDIEAIYSLNANLQDLDESFATDKDMNRTNVPVHALLRVKGDVKQPMISFDLEFPTLTSDAYRKVKSVISTDDMMNRQIIYLLALNRFYTPNYMGATSKNNELASVASSTISSQLSSMLGQLSENWSIAPNFRSDKGDFSDMEVDLALSSQLLNNRLIFNGNFGYRDNTLNTRNSNFIGDFDLEYLLNKNGNIRLKAYNHYNDQNYYVRSALTTQGVGVVFKHDFDRPFDFLKLNKTLKLKRDSAGTTKSNSATQKTKR